MTFLRESVVCLRSLCSLFSSTIQTETRNQTTRTPTVAAARKGGIVAVKTSCPGTPVRYLSRSAHLSDDSYTANANAEREDWWCAQAF